MEELEKEGELNIKALLDEYLPDTRGGKSKTHEEIEKEFKRLVNYYNDLWEREKEFIKKKNKDGTYNKDYKFLNRYKDKNGNTLLKVFYEKTEHEKKEKYLEDIKFNDLVKKYKDTNEPFIVGGSDYDKLRKMLRLNEFYSKVGKNEIEYNGEKYIAKYLEKKGLKEGKEELPDVDFIRGKICDKKYKRCLKLDFYLPEYKKHKIIIEFDGAQHFRHVSWSSKDTYETMEKNLQDNKNRDKLKNEYCKEKGINLYRIKHNSNKSVTKKEIDEIMDTIFPDIESSSFNLTFDKIGYIETPESKNYESKMNTNPMANLDETIYRILNNIKKQYIY